MAAITIEITFERDDPKEGDDPTYTRRMPIDPVKIPLTLIEGMESKNFGMARRALARFLKLTAEESEQLTIEHLNLIAKATGEASAIPNG